MNFDGIRNFFNLISGMWNYIPVDIMDLVEIFCYIFCCLSVVRLVSSGTEGGEG